LKAAEKLKELDKPIRVIDVFTVKPLDWETIVSSARETGNRIVVVEDHYEAGGIGDAVSSSLLTNAKGELFNVTLLNVKSVPMSGKSHELLEHFKIDATAIQEAVLAF
jgi:transketolase